MTEWSLDTRNGRRKAFTDVANGLVTGKLTMKKAELLMECIRGAERNYRVDRVPGPEELETIKLIEQAKTEGRLAGKGVTKRKNDPPESPQDPQEKGRAKKLPAPTVARGPFDEFGPQAQASMTGPEADPWDS